MTILYAGLDVSDKSTHICLVDEQGNIHWQGVCATDPDVLQKSLKKRAPELGKVILETGPLSCFLYHGLVERGVPVVCVCARHAKGVLSTRLNKSDVNAAEGLAQLARTGWYKAVHIKDQNTHLDRTLLRVRHQLVKSHADMLNQLRGLLKLFGLRLGAVTTAGKRSEKLMQLFKRKPALRPLLNPLVESLFALEEEIKKLNKQVKKVTAADPVCNRLMTVPGVGPIVALTFKASIEDPARFKHSHDVGTYAGLTPRRYQSGDVDVSGHISKRGDRILRRALYEAANSILGRLKKDCALKTWGQKLAEHKGPKRARVAVARKLAILMHRIWVSEQEFNWQKA
jgi:transposase